ncbi:DUF7344 domain-containing protein [Natronorarus salvus]|uniref:DUF7344 domain-containing protein n=1 Tax=Natronorarus salvus TaxID=3117733 RepID=UPI002F266F7C
MSDPLNPSDETASTGRVASSLSHGTVFRVLSNQHARYVLYHFIRNDDPVEDADALCASVRSIEARCEPDADPSGAGDRRRLVEEWLPPLVEVGAIEYDGRSGTVRYWRQPTLEEYAAHAAYQELGREAFS